MRLVTICVFALCLLAGSSYVQGQGCNSSAWPTKIRIEEGSLNGELIYNLSDTDDAVFYDSQSSTQFPAFIGLRNGSLYFNTTFDLDNNTDLCNELAQGGFWVVYVLCSGDTTYRTIEIRVDLTDDFPPEFVTNFTASVQELALVGQSVHSFRSSDIIDRDCGSTFLLGGTSLFAIEGGNFNHAFTINIRSGYTTVNRLLDYENRDTQFLLNISVLESDSSSNTSSKSYATLEVTITDVDDNDPVFNDTGYVLLVTENDSTSIGVWRVTDPPIAVRDPDVDVTPKENLTIWLYDTQYSSLLEVNEASGEVKLLKTLDREINESVPVVLKVQQTVNNWRSSTVTLTVTIDDVNDNRPLFDPHTYRDKIDEHSAAGTLVTVLSAIDLDKGANAEFSYTLQTDEDKFYIDTEQLEKRFFGYLRVRNPSLLDYEDTTRITVTVGTNETMPPDGGDCSTGHCSATVTVTLNDINDNSPNFTERSYDVTVENATQGTQILTVSANDADDGQNGHVTYDLQYLGPNVDCTYVIIDDVTGVVTLNSSVQRSVTCILIATACDNPAVQSQRRCTSVLVQAILVVSNYTHTLVAVGVDKDDLEPNWGDLESELSRILEVNIAIKSIQDSAGGSNVIIAGTSGTGDPLTRQELGQYVAAKDEEIQELFQGFRSSTTTEEQPPADGTNDDEDFSPLVITLIVVAAVLLVAFIIAIIVIFRGNSSQKRQKRLLQRLSTTNDLYNDPELGKSETNSTDPILPTFGDDDDDDNQGRPEGVINPIFEDECESLPQVTPRSDSDDALAEDRETGEAGGAHTEGPSRLTDADSGVPSDRENGAGDSESEGPSQDRTPVLARSEESVGRAGGSSYLDAVLRSQYLTSAEEISPGEMFDVTSPPPPADYDGDFSADPEPGPSEVPDYPEPGTSEIPDYPEPGPSEIPDYPEPAESPRDVGDVHLENQEEQETVMTFGEDEAGELSAPPPDFPPPPPPVAPPPPPPPPPSNPSGPLSLAAFLQAQTKGGNAEDDEKDDDDKEKEEEDDDEPFSSSKLGMMVRPSTPPMQRSRSRQEEEEEEEELPDEPEPDYAKKVRFSVQVTEHTEDEPSQEEKPEDEAGEEEEESASEAEVQPPGSKPVEEIDGSPPELGEEDEPTFHFNVQEELTVF